MLFCNKHFQVEFIKVERITKFIGIPLFTLMTVLFLTPFPIVIEYEHVIFHFVVSFLGVLGVWMSVRVTIFRFRKHCPNMSFGIRIALQLLITSAFSIFLAWFLFQFGSYLLIEKLNLCQGDEFFDLKNLYLTIVLFCLLINTIYESFYLFLQLSETAIESERYKKESIEAQYQNLTSRLNPHFLFNSLNTLSTIVEEDPKKAVEYIHELSLVYRYVLNSQKSTWNNLASEMKFTNSYIVLLKMRFESNLRIHVDFCEDHLNSFILPLSIQLLIENAVKHNEISNSRPLDIKIFCDGDKLLVTNNKQIRNIIPSTTKIGLHNINERYKFLVEKEVIIEDSETEFTVKIPLIKMIKNGDEQAFENHSHNAFEQ